MKYALQKLQNVVVIELEGEIWGGWDTLELKETVGEMIRHGDLHYVADLSRTGMVNSAGLGVLLAVKDLVEQGRGRLLLCGVGERTRRVMAISETSELFTIVDTREAALAALGAGPAAGPQPG